MGRTVGQRYEVLERLGDGTFFHVARARDQSLNRIVVVKVPHASAANDPAFCGALRKAVAETMALTHPNVARVYEPCEVDGKPVLVTEFVRGMNLKERIKRIAPFTLSVAVDFAIAIGEALQSAHSAGVLHGDLRPHNVIVSPDGVVKVTDFGMGAVLAASPAIAAEHMARAAAYQAPEVVAGGPRTIAADVYALGVMLYEMLTGTLPMRGEGGVAQASSPRALNSGVPIALDGVVMKALQPRTLDRYVQVADTLNDLRTIRDALRFGRSLSWSPLQPSPAVQPTSGAPRSKPSVAPRTSPASPASPAAAQVASATPVAGGASSMAKSRESDDGVSPAIKTAIVVVLILILLVIIIGGGVWLSATSAPPVHSVQNLVGMTLDQANAAADKANVHLIPHEEFSDSVEPNRVIRSDWDPSRPIQSGRTINVWVSRGGRMVWVPNLMRLSATDAESKLKDAGLTLGAVNRAYSKDVAPDCVVRQNPSAGKRVARDLPVNLTMSDGPNPTGGPEVAAGTPSADAGDNADSSNGGGNTDSSSSDSTSDDDASHSYTLRVAIPRDGRGVRRVRVEYEDAYGTQTPVDADHREGDVITKRVDAYGPRITVRVFYGDDLNPVSERTEKLRGQPQ